MDNNSRKLRFLEWKLSVKPDGYWFTSGGEKGSFGYYPHLKDVGGEYPVYPDTQIHGDLKMAARWLLELNSNDEKKALFKKIFGAKRDEKDKDLTNTPSLLFITDLCLKDKGEWDKKRFQVKPRTAIDDKRTNEEHMLVSFETAYLAGLELELEATIYLYGMFTDDEITGAKTLLNESVALLSGFGAFRSRGYGRCKELKLSEPIEKSVDSKTAVEAGKDAVQFTYALTSLVNFRNKQLSPGTAQLLEARPFITAEQMRGWFISAYKKRFGWPAISDMKSIRFSPLYPSLRKAESLQLGYPPAVTTLKVEEGRVKDMAGRTEKEASNENAQSDSGKFFSKPKQFSAGAYFTNEDTPQLIESRIEKRMRNSINDNFITLTKGGLFVQEHAHRGEIYAGTIMLYEGNEEFRKNACEMLANVRPVISGCVFKPEFLTSKEERVRVGKRALVIEPIPIESSAMKLIVNFSNASELEYEHYPMSDGKKRTELKNVSQIALDTERRYNTMLNRPRRLRIVIAPGSVLNGSDDLRDIPAEALLYDWKGFGKDWQVASYKTDTDSSGSPAPKPTVKLSDEELKKINDLVKNIDMTRSQAGFLREFLNVRRDTLLMKRIADDRAKKYEKKQKKHYAEMYRSIAAYLENKKTREMQAFVNKLLDGFYQKWWAQGDDRS